MWRNKDPRKDEVDSVAQRLRSERPEPSPLELDRIKTTAMSRARAASGRGSTRRRLAVAGLTVGLMAAGTGGVIAGGGASSNPGNAATAQYGQSVPGEGGVHGTKHHGLPMSHRHITIHLNVPRRATLALVTVKINGKTLLVLKGRQASSSIDLPNLPCGSGVTTIVVTAVTRSGTTITESRQFHLCQATASRHSGHPAKS